MFRLFFNSVVFLCCASLASCATPEPTDSQIAGSATSVRSPPNIVVIVADDLGYGDIGVNGAQLIKTPHIDALAAQGINFRQGYVTAAVCAPSRMALLTGQQQNRLGYEFNPRQRGELGIPDGVATIPGLLREQGYRTALIGKWHLGQTPALHPLNRGFDEFFGNVAGRNGYLLAPGPGDEWMDDPVGGSKPGFVPMTLYRDMEQVDVKNGYLPDLLTDEAVAFIDRNRSRPFFLTIAHNAPHSPLQANAHYLQSYRHVEDKATRIYAAMVSALDVSVGRVRAALEAAGVADRTLILVMSDNGCASYIGAGACSNGPFAGAKGTYFEGGVRVPMIAYMPGVIEGGKDYNAMVSSLDWSATFLALGGGRTQGVRQDGRSLLSYLDADPSKPLRTRIVWRTLPNFTVRDGDWKLISMARADHSGQHVLLFDMAKDPAETTNLAARHPEKVAQLTNIFVDWSAQVPKPGFESQRSGSFDLPDGTKVNVYN